MWGELGLEPTDVSFQSQDSFWYRIFMWRKLDPYHLYLVQAFPGRLLAKAY